MSEYCENLKKNKKDSTCIDIVKLNKNIICEINNIFCSFLKNINVAINLLKSEQSTMLTYSTSMYLNNMIDKTAQYIQCQLINLNYASISSSEPYIIGFNVYIKNLCKQNKLLKYFNIIKTNGVFNVVSENNVNTLTKYNYSINDYTLVVIENLLKIELQIKSLIFNYEKFIFSEEHICNDIGIDIDKCLINDH